VTLWQRRTRFALAVFAVAIVGVVIYTKRGRDVRAANPPIERIDPKATVETLGGDAIQLRGARQNLRLEFDSQVTYKDGKTKLLGVKAKVDNRGGRNYVITAKEAQIGTDQSTFDASGDVRLETDDGLVATTQQASYVDSEGIVRAPGPVQFSQGRMTGTGVGFTYDEQRDTIWLLDQAVIHFTAEGDRGAMDVTAGAAGFARKDRYMRFERTVHLVREGQVVDADDATIHLLPEQDEPKSIELRGHSRVEGGTGVGSLRLMSARDITLTYADDGRTLQQAILAGTSEIQLAAKDGSRGQQLRAEFLDVQLAADGAITRLSSRDNVEVTLPAIGDVPPRTIRSTALTATGAAGQGLTAMNFQEGTVFEEAATKEHAARTARARSLDAQLKPGTDALREAKFTGAFRFEEGPMKASSNEALYAIEQGQLALTGRDGGNPPHVADDNVAIDADRIDITLTPRKMVAAGSVRTVMQATTKPADGEAAPRRPGLLKEKEPVNVMSDSLTYEEEARRGIYTGKTRLWQGDTVIQSETLTLDETKGDLTASGKVLTTLMIGKASSPTEATQPPTIARAASFVYADQDRRAHYETAAQLNGEQGNVHADAITLFLAREENSLDRLEAKGKVSATVDKRVATGLQLMYQPAEEKYIITGAPVKLVEECRESTGKTLTFFKSSDRVIVDGNEENRTQTKGGKCPGSPD
jgi:LPS export ABC transporter protein LptC/lipopolysaccharide transport protein LptA